MSKDEKKTPDYYNVESYVKESSKKSKPRSFPERVLRRIVRVFDPTQGFWIILLGLPMTLSVAVGLVMLGLKYGAIGFYGGVGLTLSIGTYVLEKRYGRHLQVDDFPLARRIITLIPAFLGLVGLFLLMFYLAGKL